MVPRSTRSSSNSTWHSASKKAASVPGVMGTHSSAWSQVPVRRGSITTHLPPRSRILSISPSTSGQAKRLPWEAWGLAPITTRYWVRMMSGVGKVQELPYMHTDDTFLGHWSTVPAE